MLKKIWDLAGYFNKKYLLDYLVVLVLAVTVFSYLQGSFTLPEPDSFYHAKITQFLSEGTVLKQLPWLQETSLANNFVDHHFLYHLLLIPFVMLDDPLVGVKQATIIFTSLAIVAIYWLLKKFNIIWPLVYVFILLSSSGWLFRIALVKAPMIFLIFLLLAFYFLANRRWLDLFLISFFAVWAYGGWPILLVMAAIYVFGHSFLEVIKQEKTLWQKFKSPLVFRGGPWPGLISAILGLFSGLIINPYFPDNLNFYWTQIVKISVVNYQAILRVGNEWYPYGFVSFITVNPFICALLFAGIVLFICRLKKQNIYSFTWGIMSVAFLVLSLKSRRNIEFFIPFAIIFFAFAFSNYFSKLSLPKLKDIFNNKSFALILVLAVVLFSTVFLSLPNNLLSIKGSILTGFPMDRYQSSSFWLKTHTPKNAVVFHTDWDDFPPLFYYNDHNYYLVGLDPTFMYEKSPEKYFLYENITKGLIQKDLSKIIKENFNADYILLEKTYTVLDEIIKRSGDFEKLYEDKEAKIYQINLTSSNGAALAPAN